MTPHARRSSTSFLPVSRLWAQLRSAAKMPRAVPAKTEPDDEFMSELAPQTHPPHRRLSMLRPCPFIPPPIPMLGDGKKRRVDCKTAGVDPATKKFGYVPSCVVLLKCPGPCQQRQSRTMSL